MVIKEGCYNCNWRPGTSGEDGPLVADSRISDVRACVLVSVYVMGVAYVLEECG